MLNTILEKEEEHIAPQKQSNQIENKPQQISIEGNKALRMTIKNQTLKDKRLINNIFSQTANEALSKSIPTFKIKPIQLVNKIQQSRPQYQNNMVNKEYALDVILQEENQKTFKVQNCVSSSRPNSQIYKRFSKSFFDNIKNGIDQCMIFTGSQAGARVQSSIGNQNNPGVFMIVAIAILDDKYKQNYQSFDAEFSFLEYRGEKMYDLINYTEEPLIPKTKENVCNNQKVQYIEFNQHYVKICTFLQFIKLFKIALFNNKERDINTNKDRSIQDHTKQNSLQYSSVFVMRIRIKKYDTDGKLIFEQDTAMMDIDQNCNLRNNSQKNGSFSKEQNENQSTKNIKRTSQVSNRTIMDYILIEINNSNPMNKVIHYHMVEKNLLLEMIKKYLRPKEILMHKNINAQQQHQQQNTNKMSHLRQQPKEYQVGGMVVIINSFTANPFTYRQNIKLYENLTASVGAQWQAVAKPKNVQKKIINFAYSQSILNQVLSSLKSQKYTSFRDIYVIKQFYAQESKKITSDIKQYRSLVLEYSNQKKLLSYNQNLLTAFQLQLIGKCIKSDNFKEFYTSKSYLALPRQLQIKTEKVKALIKDQLKELKITQEKFYALKKKQIQNKKSQQVPDFITSFFQEKQQSKTSKNQQKFDKTIQKNKFKLLNRQETNLSEGLNHYQKFNELKKHVHDYLTEICSRVLVDEERTVTQRFIFEDNLARDLRNLKQSFKIFIKQLNNIDESKIKYFNEEPNREIENINKLIRSVRIEKKYTKKYQHPKKLNASQKCFKIKKQIIAGQRMILPKIYFTNKFTKSNSNINKSTNEKKQSVIIEIKGKLNFSTLLLNPKKAN